VKIYENIIKNDGGAHESRIVFRNVLIVRRIGVTPYFYIYHNFFLETVT